MYGPNPTTALMVAVTVAVDEEGRLPPGEADPV